MGKATMKNVYPKHIEKDVYRNGRHTGPSRFFIDTTGNVSEDCHNPTGIRIRYLSNARKTLYSSATSMLSGGEGVNVIFSLLK
jgi:hypothetical protein